ncbi:MAG: acetylglutamate kinase [Oscillospiraceae bacterium]|nr:acetylglutamate kinase [Oscillospiraceae bacterium]
MALHLSNARRAEVLTQALPYIQKYYNKVVVIKYGGNAMINEKLKQQVMEDVVLLFLVGVKVILVHGGGPEITDMLKKVGKKSVFIDGLRVTDRETAEIVQMVLAGKVNKSLVNLLEIKGGKAVGISGVDGRLIEAKPKNDQLGFVGEITSVNIEPITDLLSHGYIPVVSTVGCDKEGNIYNVNADTAAAYIAGAMKAESLISMTDIAGILKDKDDPTSLIPCVDIKKAVELFEDGTISGGMIPKVECCIDAIHRGVKKVIIMDGRVPHSLLIETLTDEGAGTMVIEDSDKVEY